MQETLEYIIGGLFIAIPLMMVIMKQTIMDLISGVMKDIFKTQSDAKVSAIYKVISIILLLIGLSIIIPLAPSNTKAENDINKEQPIQKTDAEVALEASVILADEIKKGVETKKQKDAKIIKNRNKRFVYRIGDIKNNEKSVKRLYEKLQRHNAIDISKLHVFELDRNKYFLFINSITPYKELQGSLAAFRTRLSNVEPVIEIVDLLSFCKAKQHIVEAKSFNYRKLSISKFRCN